MEHDKKKTYLLLLFFSFKHGHVKSIKLASVHAWYLKTSRKRLEHCDLEPKFLGWNLNFLIKFLIKNFPIKNTKQYQFL